MTKEDGTDYICTSYMMASANYPLPSDRSSPVGSRRDGTFADTSDLWMMLLISPCRRVSPLTFLQLAHALCTILTY